MSALHQSVTDTTPATETGARRVLRLVPTGPQPVGRVPFLAIVGSLLLLGMVGLLLLNTQLQNQAFEASKLRRQAQQLTFTERELEDALVVANSTQSITRKATEAGLRPNHGVAYLVLPEGTVAGRPAVQDGGYLPEALSLTEAEVRDNNRAEAASTADHRREDETKAVDKARQRLLDARAKAEAEVRAKAEAEARAKADAARAAQPGAPAPAPGAPVPGRPAPAPNAVAGGVR